MLRCLLCSRRPRGSTLTILRNEKLKTLKLQLFTQEDSQCTLTEAGEALRGMPGFDDLEADEPEAETCVRRDPNHRLSAVTFRPQR